MTNRSVILPEYNNNLIRALLSLKVEETTIPMLRNDEVLVEMKATPCNPSDIAFLRGSYNIVKELPAVPGFEGAGIIVETTANNKDLLHQRVSCYINEKDSGTWSKYFKVKARDCIVLKNGISFEQAAGLSINPVTAWAMFHEAIISGTRAIVQNAAAGQLGKFINVLAAKNGIEVINLVRKVDHINSLKDEGYEHVIDVTGENFNEHYTSIVTRLNPLVAFDAVGGDLTGMMLNPMPGGSKVFVYGGLSGAQIGGIDAMGVIFKRKSIVGFNLNEWMIKVSREKFLEITSEIQDLFLRGDFKTSIQGIYSLDEVVSALRVYVKSMSAGKILLTP
ncbi:MAG: zinc-binding dehydrogenase [Bacteroidales bacterium]|nr:zinc-binding dehydrogenase [Bacteroidales bacterium]MCF8406165.1 zinc-binding dehydrogenase [Bacteroidales bacterium]